MEELILPPHTQKHRSETAAAKTRYFHVTRIQIKMI